MKLERKESKIKPQFKIADDFLLQTMDSETITKYLDEQIALREMPIEKRIKRARS